MYYWDELRGRPELSLAQAVGIEVGAPKAAGVCVHEVESAMPGGVSIAALVFVLHKSSNERALLREVYAFSSADVRVAQVVRQGRQKLSGWLTVRVSKHHKFASRDRHARVTRCSWPHVVRKPQHTCARLLGPTRGVVAGSVVHHDDFVFLAGKRLSQ